MAHHVSLVEKVLISKLKIGDYRAYSDIFTAYYKDLVIFASRITHDLNNAEEIVQDSFVKLWEEHEFININLSLKSYLLKTVQNKCIDFIISDYDQNSFQDLVLQEKAYEFIFEGKRWYDLKRTGKAAQVILAAKGITIAEKAYLWPIPISEINFNKALNPAIDQNPGY